MLNFSAPGISMAKSRKRVIFFKRTVSFDYCQSQGDQFVSNGIDDGHLVFSFAYFSVEIILESGDRSDRIPG